MLKRSFDILITLGMLCLLWPFTALIAAAVWMASGRPILFSQDRVGRNFQRFRLLKFRSMRPNGSGPSITASGDLRVTRIGRFLRATKLDELPQLWNVLRGEMSLVGPRPEIPQYVELFRERYQVVLSVRPGITDLASIRFRNEESLLASSPNVEELYVTRILPEKLDLAEKYIRTRSMWLDLRILMQTLGAVLRLAQ